LISREDGFVVLGAAEDGPRALACVLELPVDLVLIDMAGEDCHELVRAITGLARFVKVVALAVSERDPEVAALAEAGISGYVRREASVDELVATLRAALRGEVLCSPRVAASLVRRVATLAANAAPEPVLNRLTMRERQIINLIREGLSNKQIARRLSIEVTTVKNHVHNILHKVNLSTRAEVAALFPAGAGYMLQGTAP
jgi:DNA-binding NarL/FixJ family response regulator